MSLGLNWIKSYNINYKLFWQLSFPILEEKKASKMAIFGPFVVFFWLLLRYLSQNWDSDGFFLWLNWFEPQLVQILMHINLQLRLQRINVHQSLITISMNFKASYFAKVLQKNYVIMAFYYITFLWPLAKICHITFHHHCVS